MNNVNLELNELHNLKEWAKIINVEYKDSTCSRKALVKELECYGEFKKVGRRYQFTEIYDTPKEKYDGRGDVNRQGDKGVNENSHLHSTTNYPELQFLILDYINKYKQDTIHVSHKVLASKVITNDNYYFSMKNQKYFNIYMKKNNKLSNNTITKDLFENINTSTQNILSTAFKNLKEKYNLQYVYNYIIIELVDANTEETREATTEEIKIIKNTEKLFISKFNIKNKTKIKNLNDVNYLTRKLFHEFYEELNIEVFEALYNHDRIEIKMYFKGYIIEKINNIDKILEGVNIKQIKKQLNKKFITNSINNIERKIERKENKINKYIDEKIKNDDTWGICDEYNIEKIIKNKFGYHDVLMIKEEYKTEYIDILNFILDINEKDIEMELRNIITEIS